MQSLELGTNSTLIHLAKPLPKAITPASQPGPQTLGMGADSPRRAGCSSASARRGPQQPPRISSPGAEKGRQQSGAPGGGGGGGPPSRDLAFTEDGAGPLAASRLRGGRCRLPSSHGSDDGRAGDPRRVRRPPTPHSPALMPAPRAHRRPRRCGPWPGSRRARGPGKGRGPSGPGGAGLGTR